MANDAFSAQIVKLVREMSDDAILALVKNQLGSITLPAAPVAAAAAAPAPAARRRGRPRGTGAAAAPAPAKAAPAKKAAPARRGPGRPRKTAALSAERKQVLDQVEKIVKGSNGLSASEVARMAGIPQTRAAAALKELKLAKVIAQGGDRRFARYAVDQKTADAASLNARKTASGPAAAAAAAAGAPPPAPVKKAVPPKVRKRVAAPAPAAAK